MTLATTSSSHPSSAEPGAGNLIVRSHNYSPPNNRAIIVRPDYTLGLAKLRHGKPPPAQNQQRRGSGKEEEGFDVMDGASDPEVDSEADCEEEEYDDVWEMCDGDGESYRAADVKEIVQLEEICD